MKYESALRHWNRYNYLPSESFDIGNTSVFSDAYIGVQFLKSTYIYTNKFCTGLPSNSALTDTIQCYGPDGKVKNGFKDCFKCISTNEVREAVAVLLLV